MVPGVVIGILFVVLFLIAFALLMVVVTWYAITSSVMRPLKAAVYGNPSAAAGRCSRRKLKDTVLMALVMFGVGIAFGIASILVVILLIPAYAVLAIPGAIVAAIPGGMAYFITSLFQRRYWPGSLPWQWRCRCS